MELRKSSPAGVGNLLAAMKVDIRKVRAPLREFFSPASVSWVHSWRSSSSSCGHVAAMITSLASATQSFWAIARHLMLRELLPC